MPDLGGNSENGVFRSKILHIGQISQKTGLHVENYPLRAEISKTGCLGRNRPILDENSKNGLFRSNISIKGILEENNPIYGENPKNGVFKSKITNSRRKSQN